MIAALGGLLTFARSKAGEWLLAVSAAIGAIVTFALYERRAGAASVRTDELEREVADSRKATVITAEVARESGDQARADLSREFGR